MVILQLTPLFFNRQVLSTSIDNRGRKCIQNEVIKRRVGLALLDTLSTPTGGQKNGGKIKPKNGENFGTKQ